MLIVSSRDYNRPFNAGKRRLSRFLWATRWSWLELSSRFWIWAITLSDPMAWKALRSCWRARPATRCRNCVWTTVEWASEEERWAGFMRPMSPCPEQVGVTVVHCYIAHLFIWKCGVTCFSRSWRRLWRCVIRSLVRSAPPCSWRCSSQAGTDWRTMEPQHWRKHFRCWTIREMTLNYNLPK